ncbi:LLM class flavin-dependent oxidoreductase [Microbacterium sp. CPCC 204701]|uniref:LLM class flavin-dependent oxidoreductase n=1 Tax=Microbacterium sp. CPCC 204701 TaxID=2493084 RepID=UPI000FD710B3|nr:LLM class flavin-dependent oxidoreductase [Microbacterium sp. CPCC 204701]
MALRFGLALMNDFPPGTRVAERVPQLREQAREASRNGISSLWVLQHYLGTMPTLQPLPLLAALAADSGDLELGTNMFILPLRHPVGVAEEFSTLDHLSGGRAVAGFGMGYRENEFAAFGVPMDERIARYTEAIHIVRALWSGQRVTFEGRHFHIDDEKISLVPVQEGGPRILIGAGAHKAGIERAAALGDAWIVPPHVTGDRLTRAIRLYSQARSEAAPGESSRFVVRRELVLHSDRERALAEGTAARSELTAEYGRYNAPDRTADYAQLADPAAAEQKAREAYIFTDPAGAVEEFRRLESAGVTDVVLRMQWFGLAHERMLQTLALFRDQVLPQLAG